MKRISTGSISRGRKEQRRYDAYVRRTDPSICYFCHLDHPEAPPVLRKTEHFAIVKNRFSYHIWDERSVLEHLMIIPIEHTVSLAQLPPETLQEFAQLVAEYEGLGYSFYGRAADNASRSISHQHTHLLKLGGRFKKLIVYTRTPHFVLHM